MTKHTATFTARAPKRTPRTGGAIVPVGDRLEVRGKLALLGWPDFTSWAKAHGYDRQMLGAVVRVWGNRTDRGPHGGISRALMHDLRRTLDEGIGPQQRPED